MEQLVMEPRLLASESELRTSLSCGACGHSFLQSIGKNPDFPRSQVFRCEKCGFGQTVPVPTDEVLCAFYGTTYSAGRNATPGKLKFLDKRAASQFRFIRKAWKSAGRLAAKQVLDIGCGFGSFPKHCEVHGMNVTGWDPDPKAVEVARNRLSPQAQLHVGLFSPEEQPTQSFDLIALSHVLEHLAYPVAFIHRLLRLLNDDGVLFIEVPNCNEQRPSRAIRQGFGGSGHLTFSTPASLRALIETAGGEVLGQEIVGPSLRRVPGRFGRPLNSFRRLQYSSVLLTRTLCSRVSGDQPMRVNLDCFKPDVQDSENGIWLRMVCRARLPEFDPKAILWDYLRGEELQAEALLRAHVKRQTIAPKQIRTAINYMCKYGDPKLGLRLMRYSYRCTDYCFRTEQRRIAYRRLRNLYGTVKYTLIASLIRATKQPRNLLDAAVAGARRVVPTPASLQSRLAHRRALQEYPQVVERLRNLVAGRRVLILGSGPSASHLSSIPDDVVTFCVNRAVTQVEPILRGGELVWMLGGALGLRYWHHVEELSMRLPRVDWVLLEFFRHWWQYQWGPHQWQQTMRNWRLKDRVNYLRTDDDDMLMKAGMISQSNKLRFSNGVNILKYLMMMSPSQIYLAGVDLGYAGRDAAPHAYCYDPQRFVEDDGSPIISRQWQNHPLDELLVRDIGRQALPVFSHSAESRAAEYLPVKPLA